MSNDPRIGSPAPLDPLPYEAPVHQLRPGIMTALGVVSIVIAAFSALSNLSNAASPFVFMMMSRMTIPMPAPPTTAPTGGPSTGPTTVTAVMPTTMISPFQIPPSILILTSIGGFLGIAGAGILFIAGIQVLRNRRSGRKLHWIYIAVKVPLILFMAVATYLFTDAMMRNVTASMPGGAGAMPFTGWMALMQTAFAAVISLVYPITLFFLLRSRTAREYFAALTE